MVVGRTIGVLGGMGPEATILLQQKLLEAVPAQDDCNHIPLLIDMNTQVPSRIAHLIDGTGQDPSHALATMALRLQNAGATALVMPCNTAHHYAAAINETVAIPFLNMVDLAANHATNKVGSGGRIGILASPAVRKTELFEKAMARSGASVIWPDQEDALLTAIRMIKSNGVNEKAREIMYAASSQLIRAGAELQLIACSELSLIADITTPNAKVVDTLDLLVDAIVDFSFAP